MSNEALYELKDPFQYATPSGDMAEATFISLTAPTYRQIDKATPLKQAFSRAVKELQVDENLADAAEEMKANIETEKNTELDISPNQVLQILYAWTGDATKTFIHAAELFKSGTALIEGETKLTDPILKDKMSYRDFEGLVGTYLVNFIARSLMDGDA